MDIYMDFSPVSSAIYDQVLLLADKGKAANAIDVCLPVDDDEGLLLGFYHPAQHYLVVYKGRDSVDVDSSSEEVKLLAITRQPEHGRLDLLPDLLAVYTPDKGYYGKDRLEATVAVGRDIVQVVFNLVVQKKAIDQLSPSEEKRLCPKGLFRKISGGYWENLNLPVQASSIGIGDGARFSRDLHLGVHKGHQNHFYVYLQPPPAFSARGSMLLSDSSGMGIVVSGRLDGNFIPPNVFAAIQSKLMYICNASVNPVYNLPGMSGPVFGGAMPGGVVDYALRRFDIVPPVAYPLDSIKILKGPIHGDLIPSKKLHIESEGIETVYYTYTPRGDFVGEDSAVFEVDVYGYKFEVRYVFRVSKQLNQNTECPSDPFFDGGDDLDGQGDPENIHDFRDAKSIDMYIDYYLSGLYVGAQNHPFESFSFGNYRLSLLFSDLNRLSRNSLAQTTGTGPAAKITLDTDAAGYGWFIDYTPYLNDEFLPTSNPNEWVARPGSAAEGKMDRLTNWRRERCSGEAG